MIPTIAIPNTTNQIWAEMACNYNDSVTAENTIRSRYSPYETIRDDKLGCIHDKVMRKAWNRLSDTDFDSWDGIRAFHCQQMESRRKSQMPTLNEDEATNACEYPSRLHFNSAEGFQERHLIAKIAEYGHDVVTKTKTILPEFRERLTAIFTECNHYLWTEEPHKREHFSYIQDMDQEVQRAKRDCEAAKRQDARNLTAFLDEYKADPEHDDSVMSMYGRYFNAQPAISGAWSDELQKMCSDTGRSIDQLDQFFGERFDMACAAAGVDEVDTRKRVLGWYRQRNEISQTESPREVDEGSSGGSGESGKKSKPATKGRFWRRKRNE